MKEKKNDKRISFKRRAVKTSKRKKNKNLVTEQKNLKQKKTAISSPNFLSQLINLKMQL